MTVQDAVHTIPVPRPAEPADPPPARPAAAAHATAPLLGRDRPLTADEQQFALGLVVTFVVLESFIVTLLLVAEHVWS